MRDQVKQLKSLGISTECINSEQTKEENKAILKQAEQNRIKILYIAPERQESPEWLESVREIKLSMIVIDEAHCISVWGHDFRPAFRKIIDLVKLLPPNFPVLATTATATESAAQDIMQQMGGNVKYLRGNLLRENFRLNVVRVSSEDDKLAFLAQYIPKMEGTGIIYTGTRVNTEVYSNFLRCQGIDAINYNAGFNPETRRYIEEGLLNNRWKCVVAVVAKTGKLGGNNFTRSIIFLNAGRKSCPQTEIQCASSITIIESFISLTDSSHSGLSCLSGAIYKILILFCSACFRIALFSSFVCSLLMHSVEIPRDFNCLTWSRIRAMRGENITVVPSNRVAGN